MESPADNTFVETYKKWQRTNIENIVTMLRSIKNTHGEGVIKVASAAYSSLMRQRWKQIVEQINDRSIDELFKKLWEDSKALISYEVTKRDRDSLAMNVNSCFWAEEFMRLGAADIGYELCCMTEFYIAEVFNPEITYRRFKTIMNGDKYCGQYYRMIG